MKHFALSGFLRKWLLSGKSRPFFARQGPEAPGLSKSGIFGVPSARANEACRERAVSSLKTTFAGYLFLLSACLALATSCKRILLHYEGIRQPRIENHESLAKFLWSKGIDTVEILCFKDTAALNTFHSSGFGIPDAQFFNQEKKFVDYRQSTTDCNGMVSVFIEHIDAINTEPPIPGKYLDDCLKNVVHGKTGEPFKLESQPYDVYMVAYWAKYLGKLNKRKIYEWQELAKKANQQGKKMRMVLVSADYQAFWGITKDQVPEFDY